MTAAATTSTDPRSRADGLGWVTRAVFGDERITLTVGGPPPAGHTAVARYAVVPSLDRARFLLPLGAPRVTAAALLAYNALRPAKVRAMRAVLGGAARVGLVDLAPFPTLTVSLPAGVPAADALLAGRLAARLAAGPLHAACGVRPPDPNHKPTLQLFDATGRPRGYAKIGWNDATRALVTAEAAALRELPGVSGVADHPVAPRLLAEVVERDRAVAVVEPLPPTVRGVPVTEPPDTGALLAVARRGRPPAPARPLAGSPFLARLAAEAQRAADPARAQQGGGADSAGRQQDGGADSAGRQDGGAADSAGAQRDDGAGAAGARVVAAVAALARRHGATAVEFGHWHGDWVPWNLGRHAGRLVAWDWEHSGPDVPVGFDLAHDAFQRSLVLRGEPAATAAGAADAQLARLGGRLGLDEAACRLVVDAYLVEMWLRTWRLAAAGAGWNPALHPALLDVVEKRHNG
ncbi:hypothetical protein GA0070616_4790 [Micromonospora nigra]|uniref:Phosphotransferase enzyme family protein n=1 Tax=Micromonospora nigra TaxID=145857 RepID=A0A1C6SW74_9ACTN|nr:hypothetical protein [Micromonospora nigra]SCL33747.1 hypothetical protein GA0070616_4790 [Micromonospora nigra]